MWNADGSLFVPAAGGATPSGPAVTYWKLILEIPPNVSGIALLTGTGIVRRTGVGTFATGAEIGDLTDVDPTGIQDGDTLVYDASTQTYRPGAGGAGVPYFIPAGETYTVSEYLQALFSMPIDCEGFLDIDGFLVEVD